MCGRFGSSFSGKDLSQRFEIVGETPSFKAYNIAPSLRIPVVTRNSPNKAIMMNWGFIPHWVKDPTKMKIKPINARDDKILTPFYKDAILNSRCIIPFSWFCEWKRFQMDGKDHKQPYLIKIKNEPIMGFAGIYSELKGAEGFVQYTCAIITTTPNKLMKTIHNRMPVILHENDEEEWLDSETDLNKVLTYLKPYESEDMEAYRKSDKINNPRNTGKELIQPLSN